MPPEFSLTTDSIDDQRHVVAVSGEIDLFTAPELKSALGEALESGHTRIVVDLTNTSFLDSTALGVLIGAVKRLRSRDGVLTIVNIDPNPHENLQRVGQMIRQFPRTTFFVMSGVVDASLVMEAMHQGVKDFIPLPVN